jgi:hypothetical protein
MFLATIRPLFSVLFLLLIGYDGGAQSTFKVGWNTYKTGVVVHEYSYNYFYKDSVRLTVADSAKILSTIDSLVTLKILYPINQKEIYKTATFYNKKRQIIKTEDYRGDVLQLVNEWKYDEKNRKICYIEDNKISSKMYKKNFSYDSDKKTKEMVVTETAYFNGRVEFYTKSYYNKANVKYKEIRLNDNNKDVIHIETYVYGENGKVKERTVYFPEFRVTKKFDEEEGSQKAKCYRVIPMATLEKPGLGTRVSFVKRMLTKNLVALNDKDCNAFEYKFVNNVNCEIVAYTTKINRGKTVVFRLKERVP